MVKTKTIDYIKSKVYIKITLYTVFGQDTNIVQRYGTATEGYSSVIVTLTLFL